MVAAPGSWRSEGGFHSFLSGFVVAPIFEWSSGRPFNILSGRDTNNDLSSSTDRPSVDAGCPTDDNSMTARRVEIDHVETDAVLADDAQIRQRAKYGFVENVEACNRQAIAGLAQLLQRVGVAGADAAPDVALQVVAVDLGGGPRQRRVVLGGARQAQRAREPALQVAGPPVVVGAEGLALALARLGADQLLGHLDGGRRDGDAAGGGVGGDALTIPEGQREADVDQDGARAWIGKGSCFVV